MKKLLILSLIVLQYASAGISQTWKPAGNKMMTRWAKQLTPENAWKQYPRPQLERNNWQDLNGLWDYAVQKQNLPGPKKYEGKILVPFCIESSLSGVGGAFLPGDRLWYRKEFDIPSDWQSKRILLHFEAVDWETQIWVNGGLVGSHKGGYDRFSFDITPWLNPRGKQEIVVAVDDPTSFGTQPRGKQRIPPQGIWYTPVSGIWQTVWIEPVSDEAFLKEVRIVPDIDRKVVSITPFLNKPSATDYAVNITIKDNGSVTATHSVKADNKTELLIDDPKLWSPDDPFLYDIDLQLVNASGSIIDEVKSYFGMRKISLGNKNGNPVLYLNNKPLFQYGTLDQGWWPDGLYTPPSDEAMKYDIEVTKSMGFNMIRKHVKVENERWYYWCDKLGMLVWQDMPSAMALLPSGEKKKLVQLQNVPPGGEDIYKTSDESNQFETELRRLVESHYNNPCIVVWVPFNEGWGQYATCRIENLIKSWDPSRLVNPASGWELRPCGDIYDIHSYAIDVRVPPVCTDRASVVGEYGGIGYPVANHLYNPEMRNWGYQTYQSGDELLERYKEKFARIVDMKKTKGLSAAVYTQTTDVEGEINGLMTYDREVIKIPVDSLNTLHSVLYKE